MESIDSLTAAIGKPFSLDIVILGCWSIWRYRNDLLFKGIDPNLFLVFKAKRRSYAGLTDWVQHFV
jgi:hypothetical protein